MDKPSEQNAPGNAAKTTGKIYKWVPNSNVATFTKTERGLNGKPRAEETSHSVTPGEIRVPLTPVFAKGSVKSPVSVPKGGNPTSQTMQQKPLEKGQQQSLKPITEQLNPANERWD